MHRLFLLLFLLSCLLPACAGEEEPGDDDDASADDDDAADDDDDTVPAFDAEAVTITTGDDLVLAGMWRTPPDTSNMPAVLLLHQLARDRDDFLLLRDAFIEAGIATLALDLRSHGDSEQGPVPFGELASDPTQFPEDMIAGLAWIQDRAEVDPTRVGVMGLSVGANLAVVANHNRVALGVKTTVVVSANLEGIYLLAETDTLDLASAIYIAADLDLPEADDAAALGLLTSEPVDARRVGSTSAHGVDLLTASPQVLEGVIEWFVDQL